jgi:hypothetical protein
MYFWNINKLKEELKTGTLSQSEAFKYLIATTFFLAIADILPDTIYNQWDLLKGILILSITIIGTFSTYLSNNGPSGKYFLERLVSLEWVFGIRFVVFSLIIILPIYIYLGVKGLIISGKTDPFDVILYPTA